MSRRLHHSRLITHDSRGGKGGFNLTTETKTLTDATATRRAWMLVGFMWVAYFLNYSDRQVVFSIFPVLKSQLHFSDTQLGLSGSMFLWIYAIGSPIAGQIADRFSKRFLVGFSLLLWSAVTALTGLSSSAFMLLTCRALMGITEALFMPAALSLTASAHAPGTRSKAISVLATAQLAGVVMGGWFGGVMAQHSHWRTAFYALGWFGVAYAFPYLSFLKRVHEDNQAETIKSSGGLSIATLARVPTYRFLCVVFPIFSFVLWLLYTWLPNFFYEKFSLNLAQAGFVATVYLQSATLVGLLLGGTLADWLYSRTKAARLWVICAGFLISAPCVHLIGNCDSLLATKLAAAGFGLSSGLVIANFMVSSFEVVPSDTQASAVGILNLVGYVVSGFAALAGGLWKQSIGISALLSYGALLSVLAGFLLILAIKLSFPRDYARAHSIKA
jgi:predicted MFS family arabinose efflux permease